MSVFLSVCLSLYLSVYLSICLSVYLSIYLSIYPSITDFLRYTAYRFSVAFRHVCQFTAPSGVKILLLHHSFHFPFQLHFGYIQSACTPVEINVYTLYFFVHGGKNSCIYDTSFFVRGICKPSSVDFYQICRATGNFTHPEYKALQNIRRFAVTHRNIFKKYRHLGNVIK